jgi:hypothetical protein
MCCECREKLKVTHRASNGLFCHLVIGKCTEHGEIAQMIKINKTDDNMFCATKHYFAVDDYNRAYFMSRIKKMKLANEKREKMRAEKRSESDMKSSSNRKCAYSGSKA